MDKQTYLPNWIKDNLIGILLIFVLIFNNNIWLMYAGFIYKRSSLIFIRYFIINKLFKSNSCN